MKLDVNYCVVKIARDCKYLGEANNSALPIVFSAVQV